MLGVESVPDGLATGLLAGVDPVSGVYAYLFGMVGGAAVTSTALMSVQSTGAMALIVADTDLAGREDPARALATLAMLTGVAMVLAGLLGAGRLLRFVPTAVMTGFVTAVGVNIVLGQLDNLTGYAARGENRVVRALDVLVHPARVEPVTLAVGVLTIGLIVLLRRTRLGALGLVVAIVVGSVLAAVLGLLPGSPFAPVNQVRDLAELPSSLPSPRLPALRDVAALALPAASLAFVALVQGAGVAAGVPNADGRPSDASRDFVAQGAGNLLSGTFQGMPVGGSMSSSSLARSAGARSRRVFFVAGLVMAVVVVLLGGVVGRVAMPALAGLLIVVGLAAVRPARIASVARSSTLQATVLAVTFTLTMLVPLQYAVMAGVGLAIVLHVGEQSNRVRLRRLEIVDGARMREVDPPAVVAAGSVVVLQPYGSLFFASAPVLGSLLPQVSESSRPAVVVLRLRGVDQLGLSVIEVLRRYAHDLRRHGCTLVLVVSEERVHRQVADAGLLEELGAERVYRGDAWVGDAVRRAHDDAVASLNQTPGSGRG